MQEQKIKLDGWDINYLKTGNGPHTVVFLPGTLGTIWTNFQPQIKGFDLDKFTIVAWDPPGYGGSRPPEREFTPNFYAEDADLVLNLMKELNISKFSLVGWCAGAVTGMILAAKYPEVVDKLVLISPRTFLMQHEMEVFKKANNKDFWSRFKDEPTVQLHGLDFAVRTWSNLVDCLYKIYNTQNGDICSPVLKDIRCPTFILYGQKDPVVDSSNITYINTHVQGSRVHLYPEGKHNIHLQYPEDFNNRVQEFLLQEPE
ncbi:alpha/beta hydrolase fold domain-containing protein [Phthorimaea operculella]|nr:alpha/beta hydrolase fold domain-containing protein [Phthorimaea operculella]